MRHLSFLFGLEWLRGTSILPNRIFKWLLRIINNWQYFLDQGKPVIPVIWRQADVPEPLHREQYIDFSAGDYKTAVARLRDALKAPNSKTEEGKLHFLDAELPLSSVQPPASSPNQMQRFTQRAQRVLSLAKEDAVRLNHVEIGAEHFLLGMIREGGGVASRVLSDLGVATAQIESLMPISSERVTDEPGFAASGKRVLELAVDEARRLGHRYIGTEHLLLGLARIPDGIAFDVLKSLNISLTDIRNTMRRMFWDNPVLSDDEPKTPPQENSQ